MTSNAKTKSTNSNPISSASASASVSASATAPSSSAPSISATRSVSSGGKRKRTKGASAPKRRRTGSRSQGSKASAAGGNAKKRSNGAKRDPTPPMSDLEQWEHDLTQATKVDAEKVIEICQMVYLVFQESKEPVPWKIKWKEIAARISKKYDKVWTAERCKRIWRMLTATHVFPNTSEEATALNKLKIDEYLQTSKLVHHFFAPGWELKSKEACLSTLVKGKEQRDMVVKQRHLRALEESKLKQVQVKAQVAQMKVSNPLGQFNSSQTLPILAPHQPKANSASLSLQQQHQLLLMQAHVGQQQVNSMSFANADAGFALWAAETKQKVIEEALKKIREETPNLSNQEDAKRAEEKASQVHQNLWLEWLQESDACRQTYMLRSSMHTPPIAQTLTDQQKVELLQKQQQLLLMQQTLGPLQNDLSMFSNQRPNIPVAAMQEVVNQQTPKETQSNNNAAEAKNEGESSSAMPGGIAVLKKIEQGQQNGDSQS